MVHKMHEADPQENKMRALRIILLMLAFIALQAHASDGRNLGVKESASAANRFALVIGNNDYKHVEPLEKAVNDARAMGKALEQAQFTTKVIVNASRAQMNMAINRFVADVAGGGIGVFFFAGHGVQVNNQNFLIPIDLQDIQSEADIADQGVSLQGVQDKLAEARAKFSLLVIDACRNNPLPKKAGRALGGTRGMAQASSAEGQMVVFSAGANQQALDKLSNSDADPNGVFTREFLPWLTKPGVTIRDTVLQVRSSVRARAKSVNHDQFPAIYDQAEGNFYFVEGGPQVASLEPVPAPAPAPPRIKSKEEIEQETWESARDSANIGAIQEYLKQYPKGRFTGQAKVLMATLKTVPAKPAEPAASPAREDNETALWTEAQKGNSKDDYQAYLAQYPKGKYVALARSRIKKLQDDAQAAAEQQEQQAWQAAQDENSEASYTRYLKGYPNGRYAGLAKARLDKLKGDIAAKEEAELWKKAESGNDKSAVEAYLNKYPSGRYVAAASDKLKAIKEEEAKGPAMVRIPGRNYEMGKYHVTRGEFAKFVSETGYDAGNSCDVWDGSKWGVRSGSNWRNPGYTQDDTHPVACVNWYDAQAYAAWLSKKTGRQYRLPVEAEWEYACYGGSQSEYCGGNDINAVAWYDGNSGKTTHPVGQKQANGYGLYDMSGNMWQWMENKYDDKNGWRARRGGSWDNAPLNVRAAYRNYSDPAKRDNYYGFRLARTLP